MQCHKHNQIADGAEKAFVRLCTSQERLLSTAMKYCFTSRPANRMQGLENVLEQIDLFQVVTIRCDTKTDESVQPIVID